MPAVHLPWMSDDVHQNLSKIAYCFLSNFFIVFYHVFGRELNSWLALEEKLAAAIFIKNRLVEDFLHLSRPSKHKDNAA